MYAISLLSEQDFLLIEVRSYGPIFSKDIMKAKLFGTKSEAEEYNNKYICNIRTKVISMTDAEMTFELFSHLCKFQLNYLQKTGMQLSLVVSKEKRNYIAEYSINGVWLCTRIEYYTESSTTVRNGEQVTLPEALLNIKNDYVKTIAGRP